MTMPENQPRAILRVPEVLGALAALREGGTLAELSQQLNLPKTSLYRLLRTLEHGGYLSHSSGHYLLGPESFRLANLIGQAAPHAIFPACVRPVLEWLGRETQESIVLGVLSDRKTEIVYIEVIDSPAPLRFTIPLGNRRPLYAAASGMAALAFQPDADQQRYFDETAFVQLTGHTVGKAGLPAMLKTVRETGVVFDRDGSFRGASGIASPAFDCGGAFFCAVSAAGPTERIESNLPRFSELVREAGLRISRTLGFNGAYPGVV